MIYIYDDGVFNNSFVHLALTTIMHTNIRFCTARMIMDGCLNNARLLIMPGGADLYYCEKLNGAGNQAIKDFVANGGSYLGICAGAYYACAELDWACGEIAGTRELNFYEGKASGPIYDWIENKNEIYNGSWMKAVEIETNNGDRFLTQYNGGPVLLPNNDNHTVIARYTTLPNQPAAIVAGHYGQGKYVLSSPHIENYGHIAEDRLYKHLNNSYERDKAETEKLLKYAAEQQNFFKQVIDSLL